VVWSPLRTGTPWIGAMRSDTMEVVYNNLNSIAGIMNAAEDLAGP
jgi:hypothetical protein